MRLFEMRDFNLFVTEESWGLVSFKPILKRDKSRTKETAFKEMLFIYFYSDIRSDYVYITDNLVRAKEIKKDIGLPDEWKIDDVMKDAIKYYESMSLSPIAKLYKSSLKAADDISKYLEKTDELLDERTANGSTVTTLATITGSLKSVPVIMRDLKAAYKEVLSEQKEMEGRTKGSRTMGLFEDGLGEIG
jgi:hypothetical protein